MKPVRPSHERVIPRDLFNDAKLLKCLGFLSLYIHNGVDQRRFTTPPHFEIEHDGQPFNIVQDPTSGDLHCSNVKFLVHGHPIHVYTTYNSRAEFPLVAEYAGESYDVFTSVGGWNQDLLKAIDPPEEEEKTVP